MLRLLYTLQKYCPFLRKLPEPGSPFDPEKFTQLLFWRKDRLTTEKENEYIEMELIRNRDAWNLLVEIQQTFPDEDFSPALTTNRRNPFRVVIIILIIMLMIGGCIYAVSRYWRLVPVKEKTTYQIYNRPFDEIADLIGSHYNVKVIFDRKEIIHYRFTGHFDTTKPLDDFLENLTISCEINSYFDEEKNLHFK